MADEQALETGSVLDLEQKRRHGASLTNYHVARESQSPEAHVASSFRAPKSC